MADRSISFDIAAIDKASAAISEVGREVANLGERIKQASGDIEINADADFSRLFAKLDEVDAKVIKANQRRVKLQGDISDLSRQLQIASAELARTTDPKRKVEITGQIGDLLAKIAIARAELKEIERPRNGRFNLDLGSAFSQAARLASQLRALATPVTITIGIAGAATASAWIASINAGLTSIGGLAVASGGIAKAAFSGIGDAVEAMGEKATAGGGAVADSSAQIRAAAQGVKDAGRDLKEAQLDEKAAQEGLTEARKDAARTLRDLALDTEEMGLRQKDAALSVREAQADLDKIRADGKATAEQRERAELRLEEAMLRQKQVTADATDLAEKKTEADKKGITGSDQVSEAQGRLREAHLRTVRASEQLAEAQIRMQEAMKPKGGGGTAVDELAEAMAKLTPEGRRFAIFSKGLIDGPLRDLQGTAQAKFLPGLQAGIQGFMANLGGAKQNIATVATNMGGFFEKIGPSVGRAVGALLRLAGIGSGPAFTSLADTVTRLADKFTAWANSKSAEDIAADIQEIGRKAVEVKDFVVGAVNVMVGIGNALSGAWNAISGEWTRTSTAVKTEWNTLTTFVTGIPARVSGFLGAIWAPVQTAWTSTSTAVQAGWNGLVTFVTGIPARIGGLLSTMWTGLQTGWNTVWGAVQGGWNTAVGFVTGIPGRISGALGRMWEPMWNAFRTVINKVINGWNRLNLRIGGFSIPAITGPGGVTLFPGVSWGGTTISVPKINPLAVGGIVTKPTLALVGEGREPEAVVPLSKLKSMLGGTGGGINVYVTNAVVGNNDELSRVVVTAIREAKARGLLVGAGI